MSAVETISLDEFRARLDAQGVSARKHLAFKCPMCSTVQSMQSLINAGAGPDEGSVEKYIGFSCVGRFNGAAAPRKKPDGKPCNWTLGGLLRLHKMEIQTPDGERHPHFEVASPEEAKALEAAR
ncbi:hypothetical protein GOL90_28100 [Sinorhizobium medicae]|nr:hypothetical protein [Sinorhizobium medicae]MDX1097121.1 hypothetical protein [Sinorhizobium medicae]